LVAGISRPELVQSRKQIINKIILIVFGSFREGIQNQPALCGEKKCSHNFMQEMDGRTLGVKSAGEEANFVSDSIQQGNHDSSTVMIPERFSSQDLRGWSTDFGIPSLFSISVRPIGHGTPICE
jgi:hypothetical protein